MQRVPRRRNPSGSRGSRPHAASLVVTDHHGASSSLLVCGAQDPAARPKLILGQAPISISSETPRRSSAYIDVSVIS